MNIWQNAVITEKGLSLQSKLIEGTILEITRVVTGSGFVTPGLLSKQTEISSPQQTISISAVSYPEDGKCAMITSLGNDELVKGYTACQIGIFADDPDDGEILYFIAQSSDPDHGTMIPSASEMPGYNAEWTFYFKYGMADSVNVTIDKANSVSKEEMETYINTTFQAITNEEIAAEFSA